MRRPLRSKWSALSSIAVVMSMTSPLRADVDAAIGSVLHDPYLKTVHVGIKVVKLVDGKPPFVIYEREPTHPLTPASNLKLITTAAALDGLGPDFVFETKLMQRGTTLALVGDGDPSLGDAEVLAKSNWKSTTLFEKWAEALVARGVKSADKLVYDDSIDDETYVHPDWPADQIQKRYVAGVAGLNFNANCIDFYLKPKERGAVVDYTIDPPTAYAAVANSCVSGTKDAVWLTRPATSAAIELRGQTNAANVEPVSVTVADPPLLTATVLKEVLTKGGVAVGGEIARDVTVRSNAGDWKPLALYQTPIAQIIDRANKDSMNLYAESLCKRLGAAKGGVGSWATGTAAVGAFLKSVGIDDAQFHLDDGCGLSRKNVISPAAIVAVLQHEFGARHRDVYLASLSVAGVDGTLKDRFAGSKVRDRVIGKSGFIDGVSALAGFVKNRDGSTTVFSILFNGIAKGTNSKAKQLQERIVEAVDAAP